VSNKASNDSEFRRSVSRACPLRATFTHIEGLPSTLTLYKTKASSRWQCRFFHGGKMIVKSTREIKLEDAKRFAVAFYKVHTESDIPKIDLNHPGGEGRDFKTVAAQMMLREAARRDRGELAELSYRADKTRLETEIIPFFGDLSISSITEQQIQSFYSKIESRNLSSTTLSLYLMTLRKVLKFARASNFITNVPIIPSVKIRKRSRGSFTPTEYVRLIRSARGLIGVPVLNNLASIPKRFWIIPRYRYYPRDIAQVIAFMVNSFIRPSDLRTLRHRHVEVVRGNHNYLRLTLPETKAHDAPIVTLRPAVRLYEHLLTIQRSEGFGKPDDFLFLPSEQNRNYGLAVLGWMFRNLLERLDLREGPHGHPRTLYSLRHTAITLRLLYGTGIDMLTLARNARTSVEMIERHYASALTAERNIGMLQSKRNPKERN